MKKTALVIGIIILLMFLLLTSKSAGGLARPGFMQQTTYQEPIPTPTPIAAPVAPKTFNFDSSTDLKAELDEVNPQVLDSDFE